jgi:hypothetical protein
MIGMYLGLREAFSDYSLLAAPVSPTTSILGYYAKISESLGALVVPPRKLLVNLIEDLLMEGRGAAAREGYNLLASSYGSPTDAAGLLARITEVERRPPPTETVEGLLATPFPTPDEARPYLGEWVGDSWIKLEQPRTGALILRIRVEDGRVIGETINTKAPLEYRVTRWQYLKITPTGMTWGFMNGMRPRGVVLFEGTLEGDTLSGTSRFGGIDFRMPDGSSPASPSFSFKRVGKRAS